MKQNLTVILFFSFWVLNAQETKQTVILYNLIPLKVDVMSDGTITSIYGRADGFLKGYKVVQRQDRIIGNSNLAYGEDKGFSVVAKENYQLTFDPEKSFLTRPLVEKMDQIADAVLFKDEKMALIIGYTPDSSKSNSKHLFEQRMKSILSYLDIKGVDRSKVIIDADVQPLDSGTILVNIVE